MDIALLIQEYDYSGSVTQNTQEQYNQITWMDDRQKPTWAELEQRWAILNVQLKKADCKAEAKRRIAEYDWVIDTETTPDLLNRNDFIAYRSAVRQLILNPVENPVWPVVPQEEWA